jgi:hypothetical protein
MRKQYLHLSAYSCEQCNGPVVSASLAVRENEISKETDIRHVGALCLACGHRQNRATEPERARQFFPTEWEPAGVIEPRRVAVAYAETLNRAEAG